MRSTDKNCLNFRSLALIQDPKNAKRDRTKIEERWKQINKQAQTKNPQFKEPVRK
jgi:hypothetical protein